MDLPTTYGNGLSASWCVKAIVLGMWEVPVHCSKLTWNLKKGPLYINVLETGVLSWTQLRVQGLGSRVVGR